MDRMLHKYKNIFIDHIENLFIHPGIKDSLTAGTMTRNAVGH